MGRYRQPVSICVILLLICQTWSSTAYSNQQTKWLTKHMSQFGGSQVVRTPDRHLQDSSSTTTGKTGYRASLVDEDHMLHTQFDLSHMERIKRAADRSSSRALGLDSKARAAPYDNVEETSNLGRKALQVVESSFESPVEPTPGSYSMAFSLGTPPQSFIAIADTGSDLVWIQCAACTLCFPQTTPFFQPTNSSTYTSIGCSSTCDVLGNFQLQCSPTCQYTYSYGDQSSTQGDYAADTVTLENADGTGTTLVPGFSFGCGLQNNGTFMNTDGIVGLARGPISFPSQIAPYLNNSLKFSYCLVPQNSNATVTSPIIFGDTAVPTNVSAVVYTPILSPYNVSIVPYYYVNLQGISVGGVDVSIPSSAFQIDSNGNGGSIFDSGTTYTQLTTDAYTAVVTEFQAQVTYTPVDLSETVGLTVCYDITDVSQVEIPTMTFHFENADFVLPGDNIVVLFSDTTGSELYMCLSIMESPGMTIFGNNQQVDFQVVYEVDALQIGWLPLDCTTL
ncbi:unnamed protein product [Calypogeia fissa]